MKYIFKLLLLLSIPITVKISAQNGADLRKFIEVTGSAEEVIQPDEIELEIIIIEFIKDGQTIKLDKIETDFYAILNLNNVDTTSLNLSGMETYNWWYWWNNRNKPLKTKSYKVSIKGDINFLKLVENLNKKWVESISISDKKNRNIQEFRKDVKIQAIKAAKEKAIYLLESIGEHIGNVISVEELPEEKNVWYPRGNLLSNTVLSSGASNTDELENVAGIKLRYEFKVRFEIK